MLAAISVLTAYKCNVTNSQVQHFLKKLMIIGGNLVIDWDPIQGGSIVTL